MRGAVNLAGTVLAKRPCASARRPSGCGTHHAGRRAAHRAAQVQRSSYWRTQELAPRSTCEHSRDRPLVELGVRGSAPLERTEGDVKVAVASAMATGDALGDSTDSTPAGRRYPTLADLTEAETCCFAAAAPSAKRASSGR